MTSRQPTPAPPPTCSCERPLPRIRAERKGAATTICDRCGLPARLSFDAA